MKTVLKGFACIEETGGLMELRAKLDLVDVLLLLGDGVVMVVYVLVWILQKITPKR